MKVIYLAGSVSPSQGADAVHVMSICNAFSENGCDVTLIARKSDLPDNPFEYYGVKENYFKLVLVERPNIRILGGFIYGWRANQAFKKQEKPDLIYARSIQALHKVNPRKIPFIFESHWKPHNKVYYNWQKAFLKKKNLVAFVFISEGLRSIYFKLFPNSINKFTVLHDACHIPEEIKQNRNERLRVGYIGSFFKGYGYDLIPIMAEKMPEVDFHIIGGKEPILTQLREQKINNLIIHGHLPHNELLNKYSDLDIMLAPYQKSVPHIQWISPMKLFEYMSFAKPIIASDFPVIREVLNKNNSILVEADNIEQWCNAIEKLKDKNLREKLGSNAYSLFLEKYTWDSRVKEIIKLYNNYEKNNK